MVSAAGGPRAPAAQREQKVVAPVGDGPGRGAVQSEGVEWVSDSGDGSDGGTGGGGPRPGSGAGAAAAAVPRAPAGGSRAAGTDPPSASAAGGPRRRARWRWRAAAVLCTYVLLYNLARGARINFPQLLLERACRHHGLDGSSDALDCKKGEKHTPHRDTYNAAQRAASDDYLFFSLTEGLVGFFSVSAAGALGDAYGRRVPLLITSACGTAMWASIAVVPQARQMDLLLACYGVASLGGGLYGTMASAFAALADVTQGLDAATRARCFGVLEAASMAGNIVGPFLHGAAASAMGLRESFVIPAACAAAGLLLFACAFDETLEPGRRVPFGARRANAAGSVRLMLESRETVCLGCLILTAILCLQSNHVGPLYAKKQVDFSTMEIGIWTGIQHGAATVGLVVILPLVTKVASLNSVLIISAISVTLTTTACGFAVQGWQLYVLASVKMIDICIFPVCRACVATVFGKARYGESLSAVGVMEQTGSVLSPLYMLAYSATEDTVVGPVHGIVYLIGGCFGVLAVAAACACPRIEREGEATKRLTGDDAGRDGGPRLDEARPESPYSFVSTLPPC